MRICCGRTPINTAANMSHAHGHSRRDLWCPGDGITLNSSIDQLQILTTKGRTHKETKRGVPKNLGSAASERTQSEAHVTPNTGTRLMWEWRCPAARLLSGKLKGHSHVFVGHVVVVVKNRWDALLILGQL